MPDLTKLGSISNLTEKEAKYDPKISPDDEHSGCREALANAGATVNFADNRDYTLLM